MALIDELYSALRDSLRGEPPAQTIDLFAASQQEPLQPLTGALDLFRIRTSYTLASAALSRTADTVVLAGTGRFGLPQAAAENTCNVSARLVCAAGPGGEASFTLSLSVTDSPWYFSTTFPALPVWLNQPGSTDPHQPSFFQDLPLAGPVFSARSGAGQKLQLAGQLSPNAALSRFQDWLSGWPLSLSGTVELPEAAGEPPLFNLTAVSPSARMSLPPVELRDLGFNLLTYTDVDQTLYDVAAVSQLEAAATILLGSGSPVALTLSSPLSSPDQNWRLQVRYDKDRQPQTAGGTAAIASLLGASSRALVLPPAFNPFDLFKVAALEVWMRPDPRGAVPFAVEHVAVTVQLDGTWDPPIPFVRIGGIGTRWVMSWASIGGKRRPLISGSVFGDILLDKSAQPPTIHINATLPQFVVTGTLVGDTPIPIGDAFRYFFGKPGPPTKPGMAITDLQIYASPFTQEYSAAAAITMDWDLGLVILQELSFNVAATQTSISGSVQGLFRLPPDSTSRPTAADPLFLVRADYRGDEQIWTFHGRLDPSVPLDLWRLVQRFIGPPPQGLPSLVIERLETSYSTSGVYSFAGTIATRWTFTLLGTELNLAAGVSLDLAKTDPQGSASGRLAGRLSINRFALTVSRDIGIADPAYTAVLEYGKLSLTAATAWRTTKQSGRHQVLTLQLGGVTLGDILEYLASLAAPTLGFALDAPWDILKRIDLSRFVLTIDLKESSFDLVYRLNTDLVVMYIEDIGVHYQIGGKSSVELILTGRFLGQSYTSEKPLAWDVVNDAPPAIPGKGEKLLDLRYVGLGQHLRFRDPQPKTVRESVDRLIRDMQPVDDPQANPLAKSQMQFAPDSELLAGLDMTVMEALDLAVIFNDPRLYGLSIGLRGERAGPMAGLRFEILYRKVTNDIGVFRVELQLPEAFRHLELGEVSITIGTVVVEVYTNGNFFVDLGFPYERRYERSFTVQVFPFIGRGGVYFGYLNGSTSSRVPAVSNGVFSPVIELGLGLAVGVGKEVSIGPLSGGIFVEVEAIFQGVLAWFNPSSGGSPPQMYYWAQAIVAIHGKLYGKVDFKIIKVSVSLEAYAQAMVVFEAYRAAVFRLSVGVEAEAEVTILFITISFSFSVNLDASFTVGTDQPTPWMLESPAPSRARNILPAQVRRPHRLAMVQRRHAVARLRASRIAAGAGEAPEPALNWDPRRRVFRDAPHTVQVRMLPLFSIADVPLDWTGAIPPNPDPRYRVALLLLAENGVCARALTARQVLSSQANGIPPARELVEALLRWSFSACEEAGGEPGKMTAGQLRLLADMMDKPETAATGFSIAKLAAFFDTNLHLVVSGDPKHAPPAAGGMAVPAPPFFKLASPGGERDLSTYNKVGPLYEYHAGRYVDEFFPMASAQGETPPDHPASYESFASYMFRDWCLMVARAAVEQAIGAMGSTQVAAGTGSLTDVAESLPRDTIVYAVQPGDTLDSVAAATGASVAELEYLNPSLAGDLERAAAGDRLTIVLGVAPETLAMENAEKPLASGLTLALDSIECQVRSGESLRAASKRLYGVEDPARIVAEAKLTGDRRLLRAGARFQVPQLQAPLPGVTDIDLVAAVFFVRFFANTDAPDTDWYAQAVAAYNQSTLQRYDYDQTLPRNLALTVPKAARSLETTAYSTQPGDTLLRIGATLSLAQDPNGFDYEPWKLFRAAVKPDSGITVPPTMVAVLPGESLADLADRLIVHSGDVPAILPWLDELPVLNTLAALTIPSLEVSSARYPTLAGIAAGLGLTLAELAGCPAVKKTAGLFPSETKLSLSHLPAQDIETLVRQVCGSEGLGSISSQVSRHLLCGLRLPAPVVIDPKTGQVDATGDLASLYDLSGQQVAAPAAGEPLHIECDLVPGGPAWISFSPSAPLTFDYTGSELAALYPATGLGRRPESGPQPMKLAGQMPKTYGLDHRIELQAPSALAVPSPDPAPVIGHPSLWPFPSSLLAKAQSGASTPFEILRAGSQGGSANEHAAIRSSTYGTLVSVGIRRVSGCEGVYDVLGADAAGRELLLALMAYMKPEPDQPEQADPQTRLSLLVAPTPDASNPTGLAVLDAGLDSTFLVRANLATDLPLTAAPAVLHASLREPRRFVQLLWEASVSNGGGYFFGFRTAAGQDLPAGAFDSDGKATLYLLAIAREQQAVVDQYRPLLAFNTCALLGAGLDATAHAIYMEADTTADPGELATQALVPAGSIGLNLAVPRQLPPDPSQPPGEQAQARLRQLFSLLVCQLGGGPGSVYRAGRDAPPLMPQRDDGRNLALWQRQRAERRARQLGLWRAPSNEPASLWRFDQVLPVARFGPGSAAPLAEGLPAPAGDPYRGLGAAATRPQATIRLGFSDVLGNVTAQESAQAVAADVGYTDPLLSVANWPAATLTYGVAADSAGAVTLTVTLSAQPAAVTPAAASAPAAAIDMAARQAKKYSELYFQLAQPSVSASILTSLKPDTATHPIELKEGTTPLWRFAAANYVYAQAASQCKALRPQGSTLGEVLDKYGLTAGVLAAANLDQPLGALFQAGQTLSLRAYRLFAEADTATSIFDAIPEGWPKPSSAAALLALEDNSAQLPLRPGTVLAIPAKPVPLGSAARLKLRDIAEAQRTTPAQLAIDIAAAPVLRPGFVFAMGGQEVQSGGSVGSLGAVLQAFAELGVNVSITDLADAAADIPGVFQDNVTLTLTHTVSLNDETLDQMAGALLEQVAALNSGTPNLFDAGALVSVGTWTPAPQVPSTPDTLGQVASRYACPPELLLAANPGLLLVPASALILPGTVVLPPDSARTPYRLMAGDALAMVAAQFKTSALDLAKGNRNLAGTLAPGQRIAVTVAGREYTTDTIANDSFQAVSDRLAAQSADITFDATIAAIASGANYLQPGALLVCPPARLARKSDPGGALTASEVGAAYGVDALSFAKANAALAGVVARSVPLRSPDQAVTILTAECDTLNAITARFAAKGAQVGIAEILAANPSAALFQNGAAAVLPPSPATVSVEIGKLDAPFPNPVFPLTVALRLQRKRELIHPDFITADGNGPVERADALIPPPAGKDDRGMATFDAFVDSCLAALPRLRLATAKRQGERTDLWAVDFGPGGISSVDVSAPAGKDNPRIFALRPLYSSLYTATGVPVRRIDPDGTLSRETVPMDFQGVDTEVWARRFLADMDLFLSAPYADGIYRNTAARGALDRMLRAKWMLAGAIAGGLAPVIDAGDAGPEAQANARAGLSRQCAASLSEAYGISALLQFDARVASPYTDRARGLEPARLTGTAKTTGPFSLTTAVTPLEHSAPCINFTLTAPDPVHQGRFTAPIDYVYDSIEVDVEPVAGGEGRESSKWLSFVRPLAGAYRPGAVTAALALHDAPIPLRAYPGVPALLGQTGAPTQAGSQPPTLEEAALWTFGVTYSHEHAAQDEVFLTASFNVPPQPPTLQSPSDTLAAELAKYVQVADDLRAKMAGYTRGSASGAVLDNIASACAELAENVASAWKAHWAAAAARRLTQGGDDYRFGLQIAYSPEGKTMESMTLRLADPLKGPGPAGKWPGVAYRLPDGTALPLAPDPDGPRDGALTYRFIPAPVPSVPWPVFTLQWDGLNVAAVQSGRATVEVERNRALVPDLRRVNSAFVLKTAEIQARDVITPLNSWNVEIDLGGADPGPTLQNAFDALFAGASGVPITVAASYLYDLVPSSAGMPGLSSLLPAGLFPHFTLQPTAGARIGDAVEAWRAAHHPNPDGGKWAFSLLLYSSLSDRPVLVLDRLLCGLRPKS